MPSSQMFTAVFKTVNDCTIATEVYVPDIKRGGQEIPLIYVIHGGAFMLGHSRMNSQVQIQDCLSLGWLVVAPDHRLCPQVNVLEGPVSDIRSLHAWVHAGHLDAALQSHGYEVSVNKQKIVSMGTSSGGTLAHTLAFDTPAPPPAAIIDFYGAKNFSDPFWTTPLDFLKSAAEACTPEIESQVYAEQPVPTRGGVSLEGQDQSQSQAGTAPPPPPPPRYLFAMATLARGRVIDVCYPPATAAAAAAAAATAATASSSSSPSPFKPIDPLLNITPTYPATCILHGSADPLIPSRMSSEVMFAELQRQGVRDAKLISVEGEGHTFVGTMVRGDSKWERWMEALRWAEEILGSRISA